MQKYIVPGEFAGKKTFKEVLANGNLSSNSGSMEREQRLLNEATQT